MKRGLGRRYWFEVCVHAHARCATQTTSQAATELWVDQRFKFELQLDEGDAEFLHKICAVRVAPVTPFSEVKRGGAGCGLDRQVGRIRLGGRGCVSLTVALGCRDRGWGGQEFGRTRVSCESVL